MHFLARCCFLATAGLLLAHCGGAKSKLPPQVAQADSIVWAGIDYTSAQFVGVDAFNEPDKIFPGFLQSWNALFVQEVVPVMERRLRKSIRVDADAMLAHNKKATARQIHQSLEGPESQLNPDTVQRMVRGYKLNESAGVGLALVVDELNKSREQVCVYRVYFDVGSRQILDNERVCHKPAGFGFRNYWFGPIKATVLKR